MSAVAVVAPERSLAQRRDALRRANDVRSFRATLKQDVKRGRAHPLSFFEAVPELETMKVFDALLAMPKVGRVKANKLLYQSRISPSKTMGGLSDRQRRDLLTLMAAMGRGR